jgi:hypothetical protein
LAIGVNRLAAKTGGGSVEGLKEKMGAGCMTEGAAGLGAKAGEAEPKAGEAVPKAGDAVPKPALNKFSVRNCPMTNLAVGFGREGMSASGVSDSGKAGVSDSEGCECHGQADHVKK